MNSWSGSGRQIFPQLPSAILFFTGGPFQRPQRVDLVVMHGNQVLGLIGPVRKLMPDDRFAGEIVKMYVLETVYLVSPVQAFGRRRSA